VNLQGNDDRKVLEQQPQFKAWGIRQRVRAVVGPGDDRGWGEHEPSPMPEILFLKLPATMLQISPSASDISSPTLSGSMPSILEAMSTADFPSQRTLSTPHNCPANPTMEVMFKDGSDSGAATAR